MKRFYCSVCKRIKRVRKLPLQIDTPQADKVSERTGVCNLHTNPQRVIQSKQTYTEPTDVIMAHLLNKRKVAK
jgi:hypothetical protein